MQNFHGAISAGDQREHAFSLGSKFANCFPLARFPWADDGAKGNYARETVGRYRPVYSNACSHQCFPAI